MKKKIRSLLSYFAKKHNRMEKKIVSGAEDIYVFPWFAYTALTFIGDTGSPYQTREFEENLPEMEINNHKLHGFPENTIFNIILLFFKLILPAKTMLEFFAYLLCCYHGVYGNCSGLMPPTLTVTSLHIPSRIQIKTMSIRILIALMSIGFRKVLNIDAIKPKAFPTIVLALDSPIKLSFC